ncbi:tetratricopeptide repeat protein [Polaribacter aquimarinus]|uniref:Tetratricopeptide repeat protein n=1 Tax=Polaribacter aquimarinus TaxID=2100726 RepID=A0A2U2JB25_9FLAO|nr:tetratricopeptide repeat protein [Polaribacter aquimarinus]PWG05515.1 hypothetical protein DIS07_08280 [Polaribacter aquimarinus]
MRKQILALTLGLLSIATFAQKNELKAAEKAIKKGQLKEAKAIIGTLEKNEEAIEDKYKTKYYFLKGSSYGKSNVNKASTAYKKLFELEKASGKSKYTKLAKPKLEKLIQFVSSEAVKQYNAKDYKKAKKNFYLTYKLSPKDTTQLFNAALSASLDKDYDTSLKHFKKLREINYKGIVTKYFAVNKISGKVEEFPNKNLRDVAIKTTTHKTPTQKSSESKQASIIKNIGYVYVNQGKPELAVKALQEARKSNPKDINLILNEAQMYIKLERMDKFGELMEEAIKLDPTNPSLFFNLGVINQNQDRIEKAKEYYKKAIELKPDYKDALLNLAVAILSKEQAIVDEMNKNLSNAKKYNELQEKQKELFKEALPYIEKADGLSRSIETVRTLLNIYDTLEMTDKADKLRPVYKEMRSKQ